VEGLALLEANTAAVRDNQAAHAQAPMEFGVHVAVAVVATEDSVIDQVFRKCLTVLGKIPGDKKIVLDGRQRRSFSRIQRRQGAHLLPRSTWMLGQWVVERFRVGGGLHLEKQLHIFRSEQVCDRHTQVHEAVHGSTKPVELMIAVGKKIILLLELVEGAA
jgi:hypothetical protein